jgi:hypothetical protein
MSMQEVLSILTPTLLALVTALVALGIKWANAKAAWFEARAKEWESVAAETREAVNEAKISSEGNRKLIEENTRLTRGIASRSALANEKMKEVARESAFKADEIRKTIESKCDVEQDELDKLESDLKDIIRDGM